MIDSDSDSDFQIIASSTSNASLKKKSSTVTRTRSAKAVIVPAKRKARQARIDDDDKDDDEKEPEPSASKRQKPLPSSRLHTREYHRTDHLAPFLPDLLAWFEQVREKRRMPWRKRYDDLVSMEVKGQRAYEVSLPPLLPNGHSDLEERQEGVDES